MTITLKQARERVRQIQGRQKHALLREQIVELESLLAAEVAPRSVHRVGNGFFANSNGSEPTTQIIKGDCIDVLRGIPNQSIDAVITDPPYAEVDRPYGRWTEEAWFNMMNPVVNEIRRVLKPTGSAMFVIQPNCEKVGAMRPWFFEFIAKWAREWNLIQDVWWWNHAMIPTQGAISGGLLRGSLKACVWLGHPDAFRNQDRILWKISNTHQANRLAGRASRGKGLKHNCPSGISVNERTMFKLSYDRQGTTPFNVIPMSGTCPDRNSHEAATPLPLCEWWARYIVPPNPSSVVLDPFNGSGTTGVACLNEKLSYIGIERESRYIAITHERLAEAKAQLALE